MLTNTLSARGGTLLPRDTRDTLFLLAVIAWVVALQATHVPLWTTALTGTVLAWRAWLAQRAQPLPGWPWRAGLLVVALVGTWLSHGTLLGQNAGVTLVVVLLALKTLELRARRDAFVVFFLGFFALLTHFFYSQSLLTAAGILVALLGLLTAVVNAHMPVGRPTLAYAARVAGGMALLGAPIMLVLFLLFPRMAPLWGVPNTNPSGTSGLSDEMRVGDIAELALDDSIALRVRFDGRPPPAGLIYFRGPVLSRFDGREWQPPEPTWRPAARSAELRPRGEPVGYEVTLEPNRRRWLFVLEAATTAPELPGNPVRMTDDLQWVTQRPVNALVRYRAQSQLEFGHGPLQASPGLREHVALPPGFNPRTLQLALELQRAHGSGPEHARALVAAALERLQTGGYTYTLEPGVYGQHTADEFWFDRKRGFCEHIASAFAVLMRAMDIPTRIVTGYQGGEVNAVDGYWTVRQRDAHAWTEVWLQDEGWVRVDPTGSVFPSRIGPVQRRLQAPTGAVAGALQATLSPNLIALLRANWEALNNVWNQWVLDYTQNTQFDLLRSLGFGSPSWEDLALVLLAVMVTVSLAGAAWALWERQQHDPWLRLLQRVRKRLRALGLASGEHTPPRELAAQLGARFPHDPAAHALARWLLRLEAQRYAKHSPATLADLRREYRRLPWPARRAA